MVWLPTTAYRPELTGQHPIRDSGIHLLSQWTGSEQDERWCSVRPVVWEQIETWP
jgi:hypothetical protein